jgi:hypothetical protein
LKLLLKFIANLFQQNVAKWCRQFEARRGDINDEIRSGRPSFSLMKELMKTSVLTDV